MRSSLVGQLESRQIDLDAQPLNVVALAPSRCVVPGSSERPGISFGLPVLHPWGPARGSVGKETTESCSRPRRARRPAPPPRTCPLAFDDADRARGTSALDLDNLCLVSEDGDEVRAGDVGQRHAETFEGGAQPGIASPADVGHHCTATDLERESNGHGSAVSKAAPVGGHKTNFAASVSLRQSLLRAARTTGDDGEVTDDEDLEDGEGRDPDTARPDLEGIGQSDLALLLDGVAEGVDSWRLLQLRLHERIGLGIVAERGISPGCPMDVALDAVEYRLDFEDGRVSLRPRKEAVDQSRPKAVERVSRQTVALWRALGDSCVDHSVRARFRHLLFQAKAGNGRDLARDAAAEYLTATDSNWRAIDKMQFAHAALRLSLAVGDAAGAAQASHALREQAIQCAASDAPGLAARGVVILAGVSALPFDFDVLAEEVLALNVGGGQRRPHIRGLGQASSPSRPSSSVEATSTGCC